MANAFVETYLMGPPESNDTPSCVSCHSFANGLQTNQPLNFSFALQEAYPIPINALRNQRRMLALKTGVKVPGIRRSGGAKEESVTGVTCIGDFVQWQERHVSDNAHVPLVSVGI